MAFETADLILVGGGNTGFLNYDYRTEDDTMATVEAGGYFNNSDDDVNLAAGDFIRVYATDGMMMIRVSSISSGSVTTQAMDAPGPINVTGDTDTATSTLDYGHTEHATGSASKAFIPAPFAGAVFEFMIGATVGTVTSCELVTAATTQTLDVAGHRTVTIGRLTGGDGFIQLVGKSSTRWVIRGLGSVSVLS